jgi:hypothetical protein
MQLQAKDTCCRLHATGIAGCCARVASGHAAVPAPSRVMNSRRLMGSLSPRVTPYHIVLEWALCITANLAAECSDGSIASHPQPGGARAMSASPPIATEHSRCSRTPLCAISGNMHCNKRRVRIAYSITSSARADSPGGTSRPSALAAGSTKIHSRIALA